jgi:hypothetical protein
MDTYETTYEGNSGPVIYQTHLPCPYSTEVEMKAWSEGYNSAKGCSDGGCTEEEATKHKEDDNEYTSGDTTVAWAQGHEDFGYHPAPFNPAKNPDLGPTVTNYIDTTVWHDRDTQYAEAKGTYLLWTWTGGSLDGKPEWADNRPIDRAIPITTWNLRTMTLRTMNDQVVVPTRSIELPCPPYEYEYSEGGMTILAGQFKKWGAKNDWERVVTEMQEKIDEMPDGLNIEDCYINVTVTIEATTTTQVSIPLTSMVEHDNEVYMGTMDELESEAEDYVGNMADWEFDDYIENDDIDWSYADTSITESDADDVSYDIQNGVTEA